MTAPGGGFRLVGQSPVRTSRRPYDGELWEEAGVRVVSAQLLGFARSECLAGPEAGLVLVRSYWRAEVEVLAWQPQFEIVHRRMIPATQARHQVRDPDEAAARISQRALIQAHLG
jgi:hypothetical protein